MTTAYLFYKGSVLLIERSSKRNFIPGVWSGIGGHVEPNEHRDLISSCFREIGEETGLCSKDVDSLSLKYVILRQREAELRQQFVYFGTVNTSEIGTTDEGILHWIPYEKVFDYKMTDSNRLMLEHYFNNEETDDVFIGTMNGEGLEPQIHWSLVSDFEKKGEN